MQLQPIKRIVCGVWALAVFTVALAAGASGIGVVAAAMFGFLPPLALLLLWNDPTPTMSEIINENRR